MDIVEQLINKGVKIPNPESVEIGDDVAVERIEGRGTILHTGTKLYGPQTYIAQGVTIGREGPATIDNCYVGPEVALKGGYFNSAVFLRKSSCGLGTQIRQGTILEEEASIAHTVGLKQTILFPYVTLGSLINFCDCMMAGGTGRKNHSEVGSAYIHFNFTPNQDKATPSLIGDVPRGVMLNQSPIFLGGQGGLVGPCRLAYGTVLAAGTICRNDQLKENRLVIEGNTKNGSIPYKFGSFYSTNLKRILNNNFLYLANLMALKQWYHHVRSQFAGLELPQPVFEGLVITLTLGIKERVRQLARLQKIIENAAKNDDLHREFITGWPEIESSLTDMQEFEGSNNERDRLLGIIAKLIQTNGKSYIQVIKDLNTDQAATGTQWLESIVQHVMDQTSRRLPSLQ